MQAGFGSKQDAHRDLNTCLTTLLIVLHVQSRTEEGQRSLEHSLYSYAQILLAAEAPGSRKLIFCITRRGFTPRAAKRASCCRIRGHFSPLPFVPSVVNSTLPEGAAQSRSLASRYVSALVGFENENNLEPRAQQRARLADICSRASRSALGALLRFA